MRIKLPCHKCQFEDRDVRVTMPFNSNGLYTVVCPFGHESSIGLQQQLFEVLAETGVQALVDGYYRDAVSSFMASLERAYEFFIRAVLLDREIEFGIVDATWKTVASQSERQLGMFIGLYASEMKTAAPVLDQKMVTFRNGVIHKGQIPTFDEALGFAQAVVDIVQPMLSLMSDRYHEPVGLLIDWHLLSAVKSVEELHKARSTLYYPMIYVMEHGDIEFKIDVRQIVERRKAAAILERPEMLSADEKAHQT
ncbi:hypothetical protein [Sphingobium lactosutens]|jgi:hypothetical protein|uniref:hypothetical protein n=1 Tax=Sphingobium lactosutens TaxID=522773 RepID=UPI001D1941BE|nr:hypothetical protein [Sphingobium lactosutens]MCC4256992.1 hypothetical protein [Sphingobium lactosutens]